MFKVSAAPLKHGEPPETDKLTAPSVFIGDVASTTTAEAEIAVGSPIVTATEAEQPFTVSDTVQV